jgi:hypothetical protein
MHAQTLFVHMGDMHTNLSFIIIISTGVLRISSKYLQAVLLTIIGTHLKDKQ